jgi:hypothetical protein
LTFAAALLWAAAPAMAQGSIEGVVVNGVTRVGIAGALVKFYTQQGVRYETTTDFAGAFRITGVQAGQYRSSFDKVGFEPPAQTPEARVTGPDPVRFTVEMAPLGRLAGRVLDAEGNPVAGIEVE